MSARRIRVKVRVWLKVTVRFRVRVRVKVKVVELSSRFKKKQSLRFCIVLNLDSNSLGLTIGRSKRVGCYKPFSRRVVFAEV